ncbi:release factor glutamine methyltransferase [Geosmithia morbida]|uniref:Release factor glutamine methyltransferase n=1 Tax=Geosmithia morbida TaxID=1094350 RepID=A0A9P4YVA4_9HYPO|nr:release factor glutamine methyltransferase [Geosmithia morbida]KAF4123480.1 release factor glutamine methyltransferase [Geosmithia morbida]
MLPTPDTSHVPYERVYEPAEDSFLLLDTLSSTTETTFLTGRFSGDEGCPAPLAVEVGTGSGVVLAFVHAHARTLFGTRAVLTAGIDVNAYACRATGETVRRAQADNAATHALGFLGTSMGDLTSCLRSRAVDVLIFNPPYVPTSEMPLRPDGSRPDGDGKATPSFDHDSYLLSLSYAGGRDGMETTDRLIDGLPDILSPRGCAYILFCAQNKPDEVKESIPARLGRHWTAVTVGSSGKTAGREKLQIVRIWREGR